MAKAANKATTGKRGTREAPAKSPGKRAARKAAPKDKRKSATKSKPNAKRTLLGGVAKGIAWLGDKVRGAVARTKRPAKAKKKTRPKPAKQATPTQATPAQAAERSRIRDAQ